MACSGEVGWQCHARKFTCFGQHIQASDWAHGGHRTLCGFYRGVALKIQERTAPGCMLHFLWRDSKSRPARLFLVMDVCVNTFQYQILLSFFFFASPAAPIQSLRGLSGLHSGSLDCDGCEACLFERLKDRSRVKAGRMLVFVPGV